MPKIDEKVFAALKSGGGNPFSWKRGVLGKKSMCPRVGGGRAKEVSDCKID